MRYVVPWLATLLFLSGCQSFTPKPSGDNKALSTQLSYKKFWQAEGKIALSAKNYQTNASFDWHQQGDNYRLRFFGPFGVGAAWLIKEGKTVTFEDQEHGKRTAQTAEQLMAKAMGWQVPITELQHWIKGVAAPAAPITASTLDPQGNLASLDQLGWHIVYSDYRFHNGWNLPGKLVATRDAVKVVMVTKVWTLEGPLLK